MPPKKRARAARAPRGARGAPGAANEGNLRPVKEEDVWPGEAPASSSAGGRPGTAAQGAVLNQPDSGAPDEINCSSLQPVLQALYEWCQDMRSVLSSGAAAGSGPAPATPAVSNAPPGSPGSSTFIASTSVEGAGGQPAFSALPAHLAAPCGRADGGLGPGVQEGAASPSAAGGLGEEQAYADESGDAMLCRPWNVARHVSQEVKERIWKGEFVDMFDMRNKRSRRDREESDEKSLTNWILGFTVYSTVLLEKFIELGPQLSCYQHTIVLAHENYSPGAWLEYDTEFRWLKASNPEVRWDQKEVNCWLRCFSGPRVPENETFPGCGERWKSNGVCWAYNENRCTRGAANCKFRHACSFCGLPFHPEYRCYQKAFDQDSS
ncbi:hypothetical protein NDU88_011564 [Pleurodeles waltl]|uniref:C3H1-type domain-containing protein n=1 Tax=Pleurodeles waltl TaxID=8319 RepID=A0AAV7R3C8_PLEWA|nr:hypothetical protein NDU88_011564 [Pleurodeles waltl]